MTTATLRTEAHALVDRLPDTATWDDLMQEVYVRQVIERGLEDSAAGRVKDVGAVREKYGLAP